ncbi:hypothetical protein, partial [[Flexibacter] sp. ATCC 35208]|uniref:hypothetical protein n=1 Tax=[Flexibacter] sp. ATCC 35208 TaxID=1936242 RepID=UPI0009C4BEDE
RIPLPPAHPLTTSQRGDVTRRKKQKMRRKKKKKKKKKKKFIYKKKKKKKKKKKTSYILINRLNPYKYFSHVGKNNSFLKNLFWWGKN